ncbi:hypothetical protein [Anaerostipes sp.]|uniref:hypothetical protein n=1 Tax=Anaerostipes sp. TaxID=1872530 RepID=UPI0025BB214F|nr:hypothetical protein [Anaerostipes sp.]MBS7008657.1 hypothetical protein [Anaerostipes sp.]
MTVTALAFNLIGFFYIALIAIIIILFYRKLKSIDEKLGRLIEMKESEEKEN